MSRIEYVSGPAAEPVTLAEMRSHVRQGAAVTIDDALVTPLIKSCRAAVEAFTGLVLLHTTYRVWFDLDEVENKLDLRLAPLASVTSVKVYDEDGDATTATATTYYTGRYGRSPFVALKSSQSWPTPTGTQREHDYLVVEGVWGYDADGLGVSDAEYLIAKQAVMKWVFYDYANRGNMDSEKLLHATAQVYRTVPPELMGTLNSIKRRML